MAWLVCIRCGQTGHQSYACRLPILPPQKPEPPDDADGEGDTLDWTQLYLPS